MSVKSVLILNGPGLDGGGRTEEVCGKLCRDLGMEVSFRQGNSAGDLLDWVSHHAAQFDAVIINPSGFDAASAEYRSAVKALAGLKKPVIEVHPTNIFQDSTGGVEPLRSPGAQIAIISGLGLQAYALAIRSLAQR